MKAKTVLITGASSGFGRATARLFAEAGAKLILIARRKERLEAFAEELLKKYACNVVPLNIDVRDMTQVEKELKPIHVDILINNAGLVRGLDKVWEISPNDWNEMIDTNVKGLLNISRQVIPKMIAANKGHIINVGSTSGHGTYPGGGVYCATKFAVRALTDTLRMELVATPIRVSMISPGMAETEFSTVRFYGDQKKADKVYEGIKALKAHDIAEAIYFIASRPPHVTIADLVMYPTNQATPMVIHRDVK